MNRKKRWGIFLLVSVFLGVVSLVGSGCGSSGSSGGSGSATVSTDATANKKLLTSFTGSNSATMAGTWTNKTFLSTGDVDATISFNSTTNIATIVFDIDGSVYGGNDPAAETFTLDMTNFITKGTDTLTATSATYGDLSVTLTFNTDSTGTFTGTATNEPTGSVTNATFSGSFSISNGVVTVTIADSSFTFLGTPVTCSNQLTTTLN